MTKRERFGAKTARRILTRIRYDRVREAKTSFPTSLSEELDRQSRIVERRRREVLCLEVLAGKQVKEAPRDQGSQAGSCAVQLRGEVSGQVCEPNTTSHQRR